MVKIGDWVKSSRDVYVYGEVIDHKHISNALFDYDIFRVKDEEGVEHWINGMYLKKVKGGE